MHDYVDDIRIPNGLRPVFKGRYRIRRIHPAQEPGWSRVPLRLGFSFLSVSRQYFTTTLDFLRPHA